MFMDLHRPATCIFGPSPTNHHGNTSNCSSPHKQHYHLPNFPIPEGPTSVTFSFLFDCGLQLASCYRVPVHTIPTTPTTRTLATIDLNQLELIKHINSIELCDRPGTMHIETS